MDKKRILVVEDDFNIRSGLLALLETNGYLVRTAADGEEGLAAFRREAPDLVLLDVMMPGKNGYEVCRAIRESPSRVPIIMLTAKDDELDKVAGLEAGADDYIVKPFGVRELHARIQAVLRRTQYSSSPAQAASTFRFGADTVDRARYTLTRPGAETPVELTARELALLAYFAASPGVVLTRDQLLNAVWGVSYCGTTRTLDQHIANLRKKLSDAAVLETVHGIGYRYTP